jgi:hypothetical protein
MKKTITSQEPVRNIMKTGEWGDAEAYRVACDCHHPDHDLDVWIEVEDDQETREVTITFHREMYTPVWDQSFNRFREAFRILFFGHSRHAGSIIMRRDVAQNFLNAVQTSIDRLKEKK